jgi:hypothetical protein
MPWQYENAMHTRRLEDPHGLPADAPHDVPRALSHTLAVPALAPVRPGDVPALVELHGVRVRLRVARVPDEGDALVDLDDRAEQRARPADVQVEDLRPRLVPDDERVAQAARDEQRVPLALALEQRVRRDGRAQPDVVCI